MPAPPGSIALSSFSTDAFRPADRHEAWRSRDWPTIGPVFDTSPLAGFHNRSDRFALGSMVVHVSDMGAQRYRRDPARIRGDDLDHLIVTLPQTGEMRGDSAGVEVVGAPGKLAVTDLARPHAHVSSDSRTLMLTIPRTVLRGAGIPPDRLHGLVAGGVPVNLLRDHIAAIHRVAGSLASGQAAALGETLMILLRLAIADAAGFAPAGLAPEQQFETLRVRAGHLIEAELASPGLGVALLCRRLCVSRSALYRAFEAEGGVLARIRDRRLVLAGEVLRADPRITVAGVAERVGFADPAHFSRSFRAHHGHSPRDHRQSDLAPLGGTPGHARGTPVHSPVPERR